MHLELASYPVREVVFGTTTEYRDGVLHVDQAGLEARLADDEALRSVQLDVAYPGESTRIVHVLDVLEARTKVDPPSPGLAGVLGGPYTAGDGRTNRLAGLAIVQSGRFPYQEGLRMLRESIIDMSGPAAQLVPFAETINLVMMCEPTPTASNAEYDHAIRLAGIKLADELARATLGQQPQEVKSYRLAEPRPDLPRVVWICIVQSLGLLEHTLIYGESTTGKLPVPMHPNEVIDGALISGNFMFSCQRNRTYLYQNNALLEELYALDGRELNLAGVIMLPSMRHTLPEKERVAAFAAKTAKMLGANGAIITQEGGGHGGVDFMLACDRCDRLGIKTVLMNNESADAAGTDTSFVDFVPSADAMVSTGKTEELITLPAMDRVIGGDLLEFEGVVQDPSKSFVTTLRPLCCATSQIGANRLTALQY